MRATSAKLRCRCAGCLIAAMIAAAPACRFDSPGDAAAASAITDGGAGTMDAPGVPASNTPSVHEDHARPALAARCVPVSNAPCVHEEPVPRVPSARGVPAERGPRLPRQHFTLSRPADDRRGLPAIRRHRGAFLVRAVDPAGASADTTAIDPRDLPHRPSGSPHRELLRRVIGL